MAGWLQCWRLKAIHVYEFLGGRYTTLGVVEIVVWCMRRAGTANLSRAGMLRMNGWLVVIVLVLVTHIVILATDRRTDGLTARYQ